MLNDILNALQPYHPKHAASNRYECCCPCHNDKKPSLIMYINNDWVNIECMAGCSKESVLGALGLKKSDLYIGDKPYKAKVVREMVYPYKKADGALSYSKKRLDYEDGTKSFLFVLPDGTVGLKGLPHIPYNLPDVEKATTVYFVEGEKCADAVIKQGCTATTLDCGARSKLQKADVKYFKGKNVVIIPDNDDPGMKYAAMLKKQIPWATIKHLQGLPPKGDIYDWLQAGHSMSEIDDLPETKLDDIEDGEDNEGNIPDYALDKRQQSTILLDIIKDVKAELFSDENNDAFIEIPVDQHKEIYEVDSSNFELWAQRVFYQTTKKAICNDGLKQAVAILVAETKFGGKEKHALDVRVARKDSSFYYDLTNSVWSAVRINAEGWSVVKDVPKIFRRYRHQTPQATPQSGGDINKIFSYINMSNYKTLFICWLVSCFVPDIPHPMPIFYGEKGAAKSTTCVLLKRLIDPFAGDALQLSKDERSLVVNLQQHYFLPFDNVSAITNDTSDTLCRAITGGAVQQRKLHTNGDDCIFTFKRCLALNGINNVANRADLLDRSILFELERVAENKRRELQEIYDSFEADRPYLLGAIFDVLVKAIQVYPTVKLDKLTRMADFCRWGYAIAEATGRGGNEFLQEYKSNQSIQNGEAINADTVAYLIVEFMRDRADWQGRVSVLFNELRDEAEKHGINPKCKSMPQAPNNLSRRIKAVKSNLEAAGITFEFDNKRSDGVYLTFINESLSSLPPYYVDATKILGVSHGGDGNGDTSIPIDSSSIPAPNDTGTNGDNGDNEDDFTDVQF